jgi:hypothetical protein
MSGAANLVEGEQTYKSITARRETTSGGDYERNLITLCADCHRLVHRKLKPDAPYFLHEVPYLDLTTNSC